jgi:hypothetical protein
MLFRDDMVNLKGEETILLADPAVFATIPGAVDHLAP